MKIPKPNTSNLQSFENTQLSSSNLTEVNGGKTTITRTNSPNTYSILIQSPQLQRSAEICVMINDIATFRNIRTTIRRFF